MELRTASKQFSAAVGLEHQINKFACGYLQCLYIGALDEYRKEARYERARLMRQNPLDYKAVRQMDYELEQASLHLQRLEIDVSFTE